jgi:hypothetical protein
MGSSSADLILIAHFLWAVWMISGVGLALAGFRWPRFWRWRVFRITHLIGLLATATVPIWAAGICPLTTWEWGRRSAGPGPGSAASPESFLARILEELLYLDVDPLVLSLVTAAGALVTVVIFVLHPPRRAQSHTGGGSSR